MDNEKSSTANKKSILIFILAIIWIVLVLLGYYYVHKPFQADTLIAVISASIDLLLGIGLIFLAGGIGRKINKFDTLSGLEKIAVQAALGGLLLGLFTFVLGIAHLYYRLVIWLVFIVGITYCLREIKGWYTELISVLHESKKAGKFQKILIAAAILFCGIQLFIALAPPAKWDALTYHLDIPRHYLATHALIYLPENPYWGHPQIAEMINTFAMGLFRPQTAAITSWGFGNVFFIGLYGFSKTYYERFSSSGNPAEAGWVTLVALLVGYTIRYLLGWAYSDLLAALFGLAAMILFFRWQDTQQPSLFRWAILFIGGAITIKWTEGVLLVGILFGLFLFRKSRPLRLKLIVESIGILLLLITPWLIKNYVYTGNPLYPFFSPTSEFDSTRLAAANLENPGLDIWSQVFLPFSITFMGVDTATGFSSDPGPLLLLFGIPGLFFLRKNTFAWLIFLMVLPAAIAIAVLSRWYGHLIQPRLYLSILPAVALPVGLGWLKLQEMTVFNVRLRRVLEAIILSIVIFGLVQDAQYVTKVNPFQVVFNANQSEAYLGNATGPYAEAVKAVNDLGDTAKVMMLWEPRGLYMPLNAQQDLWIDRFQTDMRVYKTPPQLINSWCSDGFSHIIVYKLGEELIGPQSGEKSQEWDAYLGLIQLLRNHVKVNAMYDMYSLECGKPG